MEQLFFKLGCVFFALAAIDKLFDIILTIKVEFFEKEVEEQPE